MTPATINAKQLAKALGVGTWTIYQGAKQGTLPVAPIRVGSRMVWPSATVAALLGVESLDLDDSDEGP